MPTPNQQSESQQPIASATAVAITRPAPQPGVISKLRDGAVAGIGLVGGGGVIYGAFELLHAEPEKGFDLLKSWGPQFIIALFAVWAVNGFLRQLLGSWEKLGDRFIGSLDAIGLEQKRQADAAEAKASKDDREQERIATLVEYAAQQSRQAFEIVNRVAVSVDKMSAQMDRMESKQGQ